MNKEKKITIGIDAANISGGGGLTHLVELLRAANPSEFDIEKVIIWGGKHTLSEIDDQLWLEKSNPPALNKGLFWRVMWQRYSLCKTAREYRCDVLFVPGGSYAGDFHPVVAMSQNLLPFDIAELKRYGITFFTLKLLLLRVVQSRTFRKADGLIFLTDYARQVVLRIAGPLQAKISIIPHGLNPRFLREPKPQRPVSEYSEANPYRVLYVSTIDQYKHQWFVVEAINFLRRKGFPVILDLVGSAYPRSLKRLNETLVKLNANNAWVRHHGVIPFNKLHQNYAEADLGLFASSCENMPNILLEKMASGLPIACSNRGPMPEVLGLGGIYFDPEQSSEIAYALQKLIVSPQLRTKLAEVSHRQALDYSWISCAQDTLRFLASFSKSESYRKC